MNLVNLALLCSLIATSFVYKSEARLHAESIVGGNPASVSEHTYAVSVQSGDLHFCGGGILNNRYILTTAHCYMDARTNKFINADYVVVAGVANAHNKEEQSREVREVAKISIPREYNHEPSVGNSMFADIAVLELKSVLVLNQFLTHLVLPPNVMPHPTYADQLAVVCAYGHNWVNRNHVGQANEEVCTGSYCYERRWAEVDVRSNMACRNFFSNIRDNQLCGHMRQRSPVTEGLCTGDSGAPLVIGNIIIGVVSSSPEGCREDFVPAIYTRVTSFIPFIVSAINGGQRGMRVAKYQRKLCGLLCTKKVLVEQ